MSIWHQGFKLMCDSSWQHTEAWPHTFTADGARTERTAIDHARQANWFVGAIRIVSGIPKREVRTIKLVLCPRCKYKVGA